MMTPCPDCGGTGLDQMYNTGCPCGTCRGTSIAYYHDGRMVSLRALVCAEPEWAINRLVVERSEAERLRAEVAQLTEDKEEQAREIERLREAVRAYAEWVCKRCAGYGSCGTWSPTCRECPIYTHPEVPRE